MPASASGTLSPNPWDLSLSRQNMASVYLQTGRQREAVAELQKDAAESPHGLKKVLEEILGLSQRRYVPPDYIAVVYEGLGERDRALQWFEKACAERSINGW